MITSSPGPTPAATIAALAVLGLAVSGLWPTVLALAGDRFPTAGASMYSLLSAAGNLGGLVGPLVIGLVAERWGLRSGMAVLVVAPLVVVALQQYLRRSPSPDGEA